MSRVRSTLLLVLISLTIVSVLGIKSNPSQTSSNSWGSATGSKCFSENVRSYGTSQTLSIVTMTNINYIRCWSGSSLLPTTANLIAGGIGTKAATIQLSSRYRKLNGGCEALCV